MRTIRDARTLVTNKSRTNTAATAIDEPLPIPCEAPPDGARALTVIHLRNPDSLHRRASIPDQKDSEKAVTRLTRHIREGNTVETGTNGHLQTLTSVPTEKESVESVVETPGKRLSAGAVLAERVFSLGWSS